MNNALMERKQIRTYEEHSEPYGLTYGAWTVKWWQWALSTPTSINPVIDEPVSNGTSISLLRTYGF